MENEVREEASTGGNSLRRRRSFEAWEVQKRRRDVIEDRWAGLGDGPCRWEEVLLHGFV